MDKTRFKFKDRVSEYPNRFKLRAADDDYEEVVLLEPDEGEVTDEGTPFNAETLNEWTGAVSDVVDELKAAAGTLAEKGGTVVKVSGNIEPVINFTSDPQTQLNNKQSTLSSGNNIKTVNGTSLLGAGDLVNSVVYVGNELKERVNFTTDPQTQIDGKQATLISGTNIKTINGTSLLGSGDLTNSVVYVGNDLKKRVDFTSDPQTQINATNSMLSNMATKQYVDERSTSTMRPLSDWWNFQETNEPSDFRNKVSGNITVSGYYFTINGILFVQGRIEISGNTILRSQGERGYVTRQSFSTFQEVPVLLFADYGDYARQAYSAVCHIKQDGIYMPVGLGGGTAEGAPNAPVKKITFNFCCKY